MRLLMITRKVDKDDSQAGFIYNWVKKLGQKIDQLKVICLEKGNIAGLPENIEVFSLGKEKGKNRLKEFINFQKGALKFIRKVDGVFCHQNPEYTILIAPYAKLFRKKIVTWYAHKHIDWRIRLINFLADRILTPNEASFGLDSPKKKVIGHGIDTDFFKPSKENNQVFQIVSVGRISPIKNYETLIEAIDKSLSVGVQIAGSVVLENQREYFEQLKKKAKGKQIEFLGGLSQNELVKLYQSSDLAINLSPTGALDKAGLEAMACGLPLLACNQDYAKDFGSYANQLLFKEKNPEDLANKIRNLAGQDNLEEIGLFLREQVIRHHNLDNLLEKIVKCF